MNRNISTVLFSLVASVSLLYGCAAPRDLATDPNALPPNEQNIARKIAEHAASTCAIGSAHRRSDPSPTSVGGTQLRKSPIILKLFSSTNSSFYKAEAVIDNVWDNIYFDSKSEQVLCGELSWQAIKGAGKVVFKEVPASKSTEH